MLEPTPLYGGNADFLDALYEQYLRDPASVEERWRTYFERLAPPAAGSRRVARARPGGYRGTRSGASYRCYGAEVVRPRNGWGGQLEEAGRVVSRLVQIWTNRGHLLARVDPLGLMERPRPHVLDLEYFGLSSADLETEFFTGSRTEVVPKRMKLRDILAQLEFIYAGPIGAEFAHVSDSDERLWLQDLFQSGRLEHRFSTDERAATSCGNAHRRRGSRALSPYQVRRAEALLA